VALEHLDRASEDAAVADQARRMQEQIERRLP
jgi:hypothetical protein